MKLIKSVKGCIEAESRQLKSIIIFVVLDFIVFSMFLIDIKKFTFVIFLFFYVCSLIRAHRDLLSFKYLPNIFSLQKLYY